MQACRAWAWRILTRACVGSRRSHLRADSGALQMHSSSSGIGGHLPQAARGGGGGVLAHALSLSGRTLALGRPSFSGVGGARARARQRSSLRAQPAGEPLQGGLPGTLDTPGGAQGAAAGSGGRSKLHAGPSAEVAGLFRRRLRLQGTSVAEEAEAGQALQAAHPTATLDWAIDRAALLLSAGSLGARSRRGSSQARLSSSPAAAAEQGMLVIAERAPPGAGAALSTEQTLAGTAQALSERLATWPPQSFGRWWLAPSGSGTIARGAAEQAQTLAARATTLAGAAQAAAEPAQELSERLRTWPQDSSSRRNVGTQTRMPARGSRR